MRAPQAGSSPTENGGGKGGAVARPDAAVGMHIGGVSSIVSRQLGPESGFNRSKLNFDWIPPVGDQSHVVRIVKSVVN